MLRSLVALLAVLVLPLVGPVEGMEDYLFQNHVKLVYCAQIQTRPIYKTEDLAENCVIKVDIFYGKVNLRFFSTNFSRLQLGAI